VAGSDNGEVTTVERRDGPYLESLGDGDHRSVHNAQSEVRVGFHEVAHTFQVLCVESVQIDLVGTHLADEGGLGDGTGEFTDHVPSFGEDDLWHDEPFWGRIEESGAAAVIGIVLDRRRHERPGVDDDYRPNSSSW
jgi:hypothetical protein